MKTSFRKPLLTRFFTATLFFASLAVLTQTAWAADPFTPTKNVCPSCKDLEHDSISLNSGEKIVGKVVGSNNDFYVLYRFGEFRTLPTQQVQKIDWLNNKPRQVNQQDQVVLKNKKVFSGKIIKEQEKPAYLVIKIDELGTELIVFKSQVDAIYKNGARVTSYF